MMSSDICVSCSSVVYSLLMSEQFNCLEVQEGFLLGSVAEHTKSHISDADVAHQITTKTIYITSYHPLDLLGSLYDTSWKLREETIENVAKLAAESELKIVGWYIKRCYTKCWDAVYLRERILHKQLAEKFNSPNFLLIVFNSRYENEDCTTNYFLNILKDGKMGRLGLTISNLGNTSNSEYKLDPLNPSVYKSPALVNKVTPLKTVETGVLEATSLHQELHQSMATQLSALSQTELVYTDRLRQVLKLRSMCYANAIVPEFELPNFHSREKSENGEESNDILPVKTENTKNIDRTKETKVTKTNKTLNTPNAKVKPNTRGKSPNTIKQSAIITLEDDLNKLDVTGKTKEEHVPRTNIRNGSKTSANSSPANRKTIASQRKFSPVTNVGHRQSRSPSVNSVKKKLSESEPMKSPGDKVWK